MQYSGANAYLKIMHAVRYEDSEIAKLQDSESFIVMNPRWPEKMLEYWIFVVLQLAINYVLFGILEHRKT